MVVVRLGTGLPLRGDIVGAGCARFAQKFGPPVIAAKCHQLVGDCGLLATTAAHVRPRRALTNRLHQLVEAMRIANILRKRHPIG